ncbi:unnamed protein product [Sphenostylis stenocarpa]|uniref:Uncharacterized protein n=1 Tax=Sphenostylis stenocarpa TaxID=92480 RepID=A0AA86VQI7_9FABA|nr:unnamed protein product [Sphenostylis stenocarpa]
MKQSAIQRRITLNPTLSGGASAMHGRCINFISINPPRSKNCKIIATRMMNSERFESHVAKEKRVYVGPTKIKKILIDGFDDAMNERISKEWNIFLHASAHTIMVYYSSQVMKATNATH